MLFFIKYTYTNMIDRIYTTRTTYKKQTTHTNRLNHITMFCDVPNYIYEMIIQHYIYDDIQINQPNINYIIL